MLLQLDPATLARFWDGTSSTRHSEITKYDLIGGRWEEIQMPLSTSFERDRVLKELRFRIGLKCCEWDTAIVIPIRPFEENQIVLRYLRVASAGCSIPKSGESCWSKLQQQTGLAHSPVPKCSDYDGKEAGVADSVIAYPVEATLYPKPSVRPLGGPVRCYPQE